MFEVKFKCIWEDVIAIDLWLRENCDARYSFPMGQPGEFPTIHCPIVYFDSEEDAMAFKLTFG